MFSLSADFDALLYNACLLVYLPLFTASFNAVCFYNACLFCPSFVHCYYLYLLVFDSLFSLWVIVM